MSNEGNKGIGEVGHTWIDTRELRVDDIVAHMPNFGPHTLAWQVVASKHSFTATQVTVVNGDNTLYLHDSTNKPRMVKLLLRP